MKLECQNCEDELFLDFSDLKDNNGGDVLVVDTKKSSFILFPSDGGIFAMCEVCAEEISEKILQDIRKERGIE